MISKSRILIALGNEIKKNSVSNFKKGDVSRMYLDYLNRKYNFDEWIKLSNINSYICEKNDIILIKPIISIFEKSGTLIKNILSYLNYADTKNICIIIPDFYRSVGTYKYKSYVKIHEKLGSDFYNILNSNIINNINSCNYLQLCLGINNLQKQEKKSTHFNFLEPIDEHEYKKFLKTFELADEYFNKKILNSHYITTNYIQFKKKYSAMEPQKHFKKDTSKRRYILDIYKHMYK
ncbi:conserved Plasmodium protein, unknown function [Plasmodium gallinaceum]|uniref:Uncharacterized protein n=1 Tax=Plasmodium gallinaceum TaxID=5849 RepID=A0A1J1GQZ8_PLAGA|nr:conserved Plasmodium protein, unknown function [Plasmodium gallinaceum]CRG93703.1 conserved Plasmodium protein, unknown function [Plasmodium gallinaceum]